MRKTNKNAMYVFVLIVGVLLTGLLDGVAVCYMVMDGFEDLYWMSDHLIHGYGWGIIKHDVDNLFVIIVMVLPAALANLAIYRQIKKVRALKSVQ